MASVGPSATPTTSGEEFSAADHEAMANAHEADVAEREAYEEYGYLFRPDKTGTDKLKSLLRGLKDVMNQRYEPTEQPDLTPNQLAHFYRDLHGNYDQLFLGTPNESIAFIYKSLGCLHSLQPPAYTHATAFTDPTVPALKTEGWIMWQTIQLLLGPEEHSGFIREAVKLWDVRDHDTGAVFPKILPRECFPMEPDKHMVAWYEGVSERLRKEADEEARMRALEADDAEPVRRLHAGERPPPRRNGDPPTDDDESVDSKGPALAYFRNPLYRHVDGRPSIVRSSSKRPALSPRHTMMGKGKEAASTFGRIARSVGSPHLWDGRGSSRSRDRDSRRRSQPDPHHYHGDSLPPPATAAYDDRYSSKVSSNHSQHRRSSQVDRLGRPPSRPPADDDYNVEEPSPVYSPDPSRHPSDSDTGKHRHREDRSGVQDQRLRHSRSHEPTPSQELEGDYFAGYDDATPRRNSVQDTSYGSPHDPQGGQSVGPSFGPSASPLFASHIARQSQQPIPRNQPVHPGGPPPPHSYNGRVPTRSPSERRAQRRFSSQNPEPGGRQPSPMDHHDRRHRRYDSQGRPPPSPGYVPLQAPYDDMPPGSVGSYPSRSNRYMDSGSIPDRESRDKKDSRGSRDHRDSRDPRDRDSRRGSARMSGSDLDRYHSGDDDRRSTAKQTRFADTGVGGRRYPDESPRRERRRPS